MMEIWGISGSILHYGFTFASMCTAFIAFIYFWKKGRLSLDEEAKLQMLQNGADDESE